MNPKSWLDFLEHALEHPWRATAALLLGTVVLVLLTVLAAVLTRWALGGQGSGGERERPAYESPTATQYPTNAAGSWAAPGGSPSPPVAAGTTPPANSTSTPTPEATATPDPTPVASPTPAPTPTISPTPTLTPPPAIRVDEPQDKEKVGGVFPIRGNSTDLAGEKIYPVMHDLWPFPEWCEDPDCPRYWMQSPIFVKATGDFLGVAFACADGAHYELMLLYPITEAGRADLDAWVLDTHNRGQADLPPKKEVIVLGGNLELTADHTIEPPPAGCSATGAPP